MIRHHKQAPYLSTVYAAKAVSQTRCYYLNIIFCGVLAITTACNKQVDTFTCNSTLPPATASSGEHTSIFRPPHKNDEKLNKTDWIDAFVQHIGSNLNSDCFVTIQSHKHSQCTICVDQTEACVGVQCTCKQEELHYCTTCLFSQMDTSELRCPNTNGCKKLLPYEIVKRSNEKRVTDALEGIQTSHITHNISNQVINNTVDQALSRNDALLERYLSKSLDALRAAKAPNTDTLGIVTCPEVDCPFQELAIKQRGAVSCYFHPEIRICTQCSARWDHNHQCIGDKPFKSIAEHRQQRAFPCPKCGILTNRNGACMHMTCTQCRHHWCWYCLYHFYGSNKETDKAKTKAYPDPNTYKEQHRDRFHKTLSCFGNANSVGTDFPGYDNPRNQCPYRRYCELGPSCPCHRNNF